MKSKDLQLALDAAEKAGQIIRDGFGKISTFERKIGKGIVTEIDKKAEAAIVAILQKSSYPILGEESGFVGKKSDTYWVVDPLDGTNNFFRQVDLIATAIALIKENEVVLGVIESPLKNLTYFAEKGNGAYRNSERINVSNRQIQDTIITTNYGYGTKAVAMYKNATSILLDKVQKIRHLGTSALELCYVAQGSYEAFLSFGDELWDYAAGLILVEEAGGKVTDWKGNPWNNSNSFVLTSNGLIHLYLVHLVENLQSG